MKKLIVGLVAIIPLFGGTGSTKVVDCTAVFEQRKEEIKLEIDALEAEKQNLEALKKAASSLQTAREKKLEAKALEVSNALKSLTQKEQNLQKLVEDNKKVLDQIKNVKDDKIVQTYVKMKPAASAGVMAEMSVATAVSILSKMEPKKVAEILGKMEPKKASEITEAMKK